MSLVIVDDHIEAVKRYLTEQCDSLDRLIARYVQTMNKVAEDGFMEGRTAEAVKEFLNQVESDLGSKGATPDEMKIQVERYCIDFVKKVNKADKDLY